MSAYKGISFLYLPPKIAEKDKCLFYFINLPKTIRHKKDKKAPYKRTNQ